MTWVVLDTNILVSGLGWPEGPPGRIVDSVLEGRLILIITRPLVDELSRALRYERLAKIFDDPLALMALIETVSVVVEPTSRVHVLQDEPDNRILEAAFAGRADYIVTGDKRLRVGLRRQRLVSFCNGLQTYERALGGRGGTGRHERGPISARHGTGRHEAAPGDTSGTRLRA